MCLQDGLTPQLVVRHRGGHTLEVPPCLDVSLAEIVDAIRTGKGLRDLVHYATDPMGQYVAAESTWTQLIAELFFEYERGHERNDAFAEPLVSVLDPLADRSEPSSCWQRVREVILGNIDVLSGWKQPDDARIRRPESIERRGDRYFTERNGEEVEVIGARTSEETRWDYMFDSAKQKYGLLRALLRVVAVRNACHDYRSNPNRYPPTIRIGLSEGQYTETWFLHWEWEVPWPYQRKYLPWAPECAQCSVEWLANDLLAWFAEREHIPGRDTVEVELADDVGDFEEKTGGFPHQWELALDTTLSFGDDGEVWFTFQKHPLRWVNRTAYVLTTLVVPSKSLSDSDPYYKLALEFISVMVFEQEHSIRIVTSGGGPRRRYPLLRQPHQFGDIRIGSPRNLPDDYRSGPRKALAISLFAEAVNSGSVYYSFLSFYKVIEAAHRGVKREIYAWINGSLNDIRPSLHPERVAELRKAHANVAEYLYVQNRCAVAHAATEPIADPDDPKDRMRLMLDLPIVKALSRKAIEDGLFEEPLAARPPPPER